METREIQILIGNIGAGKSTYVKRMVDKGYVVISKDALRYMVGGGQYIYDEALEPVIHTMATGILLLLVFSRKNIIIDETNMSITERKDFMQYKYILDYKYTAIVFPKLSKEESVARRLQANHGVTPKEVWEQVWERKNAEYEEPTKEEGFYNIVNLGIDEVKNQKS